MARSRTVILAILAVGIALRLLHLDLMEFKADEVEALLVTEYWLDRGVPQFGMMASTGIPEPPGFIFILLPMVALTSAPLLVALYHTAFGILALWGFYLLGTALGSPRAGLWAAALGAVHPWLILYSRKIWPPNLLVLFVLLLLIILARCRRQIRSRSIFWAGPILSLTWQIHYSAYAATLVFLGWFVMEAVRRRINWRWAGWGFGAGLLLLSPYLTYAVRTSFVDFRHTLGEFFGERRLMVRPLVSPVKVWAGVSFAGCFGYPLSKRPAPISQTMLGREQPWLETVAVASTILVITLALAGLTLRPGRRKDQPALSAAEPWLAFFVAVPLLLCLALRRGVPPHYYFIGLPALVMLAACGLEQSRAALARFPRAGRLPSLAGAAILVGGVAVWLFFLAYINRVGGTGGDYGIAYRCQKAAAEALAGERIAPGAVDARLTRDGGIGIWYLLARKSRPPFSGRRVRLVDSLLFPDADCRPGEIIRPVPGAGPLRICFLPPETR